MLLQMKKKVVDRIKFEGTLIQTNRKFIIKKKKKKKGTILIKIKKFTHYTIYYKHISTHKSI